MIQLLNAIKNKGINIEKIYQKDVLDLQISEDSEVEETERDISCTISRKLAKDLKNIDLSDRCKYADSSSKIFVNLY